MLKRVVTFEEAEFRILAMMTATTHKFGIALGCPLEQFEQDALERLMLRDWIRLIDISTAPNASPTQPLVLFRVFRAMPEAVTWYESLKASMN